MQPRKKHAGILYQNSQSKINTFLRSDLTVEDTQHIARSASVVYSIVSHGPPRSISVGLDDGTFLGFDLNSLTPDETAALVRTCLDDKTVVVDDYVWAATLSYMLADDWRPASVFDLKYLSHVLRPDLIADGSLHLLADALHLGAPAPENAARLWLDPEYRVREIAVLMQALTKTDNMGDAIERAVELDDATGGVYFERHEPMLISAWGLYV